MGALAIAHSDKQDAAATWKKTFGHRRLMGFVDHGRGGDIVHAGWGAKAAGRLAQGPDWTTSKDDDGAPVNIEDHSPHERVFTRRMMAAWSAGDTDTFEALLGAACADPQRRHLHLRNLFQLTVDQAELHGRRGRRPFTVVRQMTTSILKEGLKRDDWNRS